MDLPGLSTISETMAPRSRGWPKRPLVCLRLLRNETVTLVFVEGADGRWTDFVVLRRRKPTWPDPRRFEYDLIETFDPPRRGTDLPVEPVPDAVTMACKINRVEMATLRGLGLRDLEMISFISSFRRSHH